MRRLKNSKRQPISATNLCNTSDDSKTASEIIHVIKHLSELNSTVTFHRVQLHLHVGNDLPHDGHLSHACCTRACDCWILNAAKQHRAFCFSCWISASRLSIRSLKRMRPCRYVEMDCKNRYSFCLIGWLSSELHIAAILNHIHAQPHTNTHTHTRTHTCVKYTLKQIKERTASCTALLSPEDHKHAPGTRNTLRKSAWDHFETHVASASRPRLLNKCTVIDNFFGSLALADLVPLRFIRSGIR